MPSRDENGLVEHDMMHSVPSGTKSRGCVIPPGRLVMAGFWPIHLEANA